MDFKEFVLYCELALGDISPTMFDVPGQNTPEVGGPILLSATVSGSDDQNSLPEGPGLDLKPADQPKRATITNLLNLPETPGSGKITHLEKGKNPIIIVVSDEQGKTHQLMMSLDEFNRIQGDRPEKGKTLTFVLQRRPDDRGHWVSQVASCRCS